MLGGVGRSTLYKKVKFILLVAKIMSKGCLKIMIERERLTRPKFLVM